MKKGEIIWLESNKFLEDDADICDEAYEEIWTKDSDKIEIDMSEFEEITEVDEETEARWEAIDRLSGTIEYGECLYCGLANGMHFNKGWFFCKTCHDCVPAEVYYQWYAGFDVYLER